MWNPFVPHGLTDGTMWTSGTDGRRAEAAVDVEAAQVDPAVIVLRRRCAVAAAAAAEGDSGRVI